MNILQRFKIWRVHHKWWKSECKPYKSKVDLTYAILPIVIFFNIIMWWFYLPFWIQNKLEKECEQ